MIVSDVHVNICFSSHQWSLPVTPVGGFGQQRHPGVWDDLFVVFALAHCVPVARTTTHRNLLLGDAKETIEKFGPLKAVLGAIPTVYTGHEVRQQAPSQIVPLTNTFQGSVAIEKKIEVLLLHIIGLEESLDSCPSDGAELDRRDKLIKYSMIHHLRSILKPF